MPASTVKMSSGRHTSPSRMRVPTSSTMIASSSRSHSGRNRPASRTPTCAPATEPSSSSPASTMSTALVVVAWIIVAAAVTNRIWNRLVPTTDAVAMPSR